MILVPLSSKIHTARGKAITCNKLWLGRKSGDVQVQQLRKSVVLDYVYSLLLEIPCNP